MDVERFKNRCSHIPFLKISLIMIGVLLCLDLRARVSRAHRDRLPPDSGTISTVAGTGRCGFEGDDGPACRASLSLSFNGLAADRSGNLYLADTWNHRIRKISSNGLITTVAGTGERGDGGDRIPATRCRLRYPTGVAVDRRGNFYIADYANHRVRKVAPDGLITTVAGTGRRGKARDGALANASPLDHPRALALDAAGNLFIADLWNRCIRKVDRRGILTTVAGTPNSAAGIQEGIRATRASLCRPTDLAVDRKGNLYIADYEMNRVRRVGPDGRIWTVKGREKPTDSRSNSASGRDLFWGPTGVEVDALGNLYIAEGLSHRVLKLSPEGWITHVAGCGSGVFSGDGGSARAAGLNGPGSLALDPDGNLYIADTLNRRVRKVSWKTPDRPLNKVASRSGVPILAY
jgi:sugar lactone lactonase YvrE